MIILRSAVYNVFFFGATFVMTLAGTVMRLAAPHRMLDVAVAWGRLLLWGARVICGIRWQVEGELPAGAALIASHHELAFDTLVWLTLVPRPAYVMKQEMLRVPLFGALTRPAGMIAVDRNGGAKAMRGLIRDAARAVTERRQIVIFPEGTRAAPGTLLPLQPGVAALASSTGLPVIPVVTDFGAVLEQTGVSQASGGDPHRAAATDPGGNEAAGTAAAVGGGVANRHVGARIFWRCGIARRLRRPTW